MSARAVTIFLWTSLSMGCGGGPADVHADASPMRDGSASASDADTDAGNALDDAGPAAFMCTTLTDPAQCWNRRVAELHGCVPDGTGTLSADRTECTYADGTTVRFDPPVPTTGDYQPTFTIFDPSGSECGSYTASGFLLGIVDVGDGTATLVQEPGPRARLTCLDGDVETVAFDATFAELTSCVTGTTDIVPPGYSSEHGAGFVRIRLMADGNRRPEPIVDCTSM